VEKGGAVKFVYIVTRGRDDATAASIPLHLAANGSVEVGHDVGIVLAGDAADIVIGDNAEKMEGVGVPPVRDLLGKLKDNKIPVYV
jgi:predicted peroxiredoxin